MLNCIEPGSYFRPHKHLNPLKREIYIILQGKAIVIQFDDPGNIEDYFILDPSIGNYGVEIPPAKYHTLIVLKTTVIYELLVITGILDDIFNLSPKIRFLIQILSVSIALFFLKGLNKLDLGFIIIQAPVFLTIIAAIGIVWFINLYNFIDGIDGYASMEAIFVGGALYYFTKNEIALLLAIATLGFLPWNWQRAKIFMGDVGSTLLGFILIVLGIYFQNKGEFSLINWLILTSLFWFDATSTLYRRWRNKEKLSVAHRKHAYQRIVQAGSSHQRTVIYAIFINLFLLISVFLAIKFPKLMVGILIIDTFLLYSVVKLIDKKKPFKEA